MSFPPCLASRRLLVLLSEPHRLEETAHQMSKLPVTLLDFDEMLLNSYFKFKLDISADVPGKYVDPDDYLHDTKLVQSENAPVE